jgi:hypothetical protein
MPCDYRDYPEDWHEISDRIRFERAGGKCEQCGAPHGALILRSIEDPARYVIYDLDTDYYRWPDGTELHGYLPEEYDAADKFTRVILTVAHLDHDTTNNDDSNLRAWCQRCHLVYDAPLHAQHARETRLQKREDEIADSGQLRLFE